MNAQLNKQLDIAMNDRSKLRAENEALKNNLKALSQEIVRLSNELRNVNKIDR